MTTAKRHQPNESQPLSKLQMAIATPLIPVTRDSTSDNNATIWQKDREMPRICDVPTVTSNLVTHVASCKYCRSTGFVRVDVPIGHAYYGRALPCLNCDKQQQIAFAAAQHYSRVPADLERMDASWLTFPSSMDARSITAMQRYSARICAGNLTEVRGVVLMGLNQVGKTGLAYCVHHDALMAQIPSVFIGEIDLMHLLTNAMFEKDRPGRHFDIIDRLATVTHLVIDDLGAAKQTDTREEFLFFLLDRRVKSPKTVTTITTNLDGPELQAHLGKRVYARIAGRSFSRLVVEGKYCSLVGGDSDV